MSLAIPILQGATTYYVKLTYTDKFARKCTSEFLERGQPLLDITRIVEAVAEQTFAMYPFFGPKPIIDSDSKVTDQRRFRSCMALISISLCRRIESGEGRLSVAFKTGRTYSEA